MHNAYALFQRNMASARDVSVLHEHLTKQVALPHSFDDLLRSQIVYAVSALDKLIHDLVRIGMMEIFAGTRPSTSKYESEPISMQVVKEIVQATVPPKEHFFEQALIRKFKSISFQDPTKIADGLSYIWNEGQKWQKIAAVLGLSDGAARTQLKLIIDRRNLIVHEADIDPVSGNKLAITKAESDDSVNFLHSCGRAIFGLVCPP